MSFRRRTVLYTAGAVAAAVVIASAVVYVLTRQELRRQIDASLQEKVTPGHSQSVRVAVAGMSAARRQALEREGIELPRGLQAKLAGQLKGATVSRTRHVGGGLEHATTQVRWIGPAGPGMLTQTLVSPARKGPHGPETAVGVFLPPQKLGGPTGYAQLVRSDGKVLRSIAGPGSLLPVTSATRAVAAGRRGPFFSEATLAGTPVRILTAPAPLAGGVLQVALPLTQVDATLRHLLIVLALVCLGGVALAAALGLLVSSTALAPVRRLTRAAERVARTEDLGHRIGAGEGGELGRLADSFNTMLAALQRSRLSQRQLISDASHELRTPLTSIQTNLDALAIGAGLDERERGRIVCSARAQLHELTALVGDLVDLSKTGVEEGEIEDVRLDLAAREAIARARLHAPATRFELDAQPCLVRVAPARLDRAIANLLDNAIKWGPREGPVEVRVADGGLEVRDHGPGIDEADLPRVFDRFYRAPAARGLPGSGLGLAIVRQVAETHGGSVSAYDDPGGGARLALQLPVLPLEPGEEREPSALVASVP